MSEQLLGLYNVNITLEIHQPTQNGSYGALYNISFSITPEAEIVSTDNNYVQLILQYNTPYNLSAVTSLCGQISDSTTIELFYGECLVAC